MAGRRIATQATLLVAPALLAGCGHVVDLDVLQSGDGGTSGAPGQTGGSSSGASPSSIEGVTATDGDTRSGLTFTDPAMATSFEYDVNGDEGWKPLAADRIVQGLTNGSKYRFRVRPLFGGGGPGAPSPPSNEVVPYGAPEAPTLTGKQSQTTLTWAWAARSTNGRALATFRTKLDMGNWTPTPDTTLARAFGYEQSHTLCVVVVTDGADGRNTSAEACVPVTVAFPRATAENTADGFSTAVAGGSRFDNEVPAGSAVSISAACFTANDIGSNNGWWYRLASSGHWVAATNFTQKTNQFGAPRANGGGGCS
jgi:hypothetical protein